MNTIEFRNNDKMETRILGYKIRCGENRKKSFFIRCLLLIIGFQKHTSNGYCCDRSDSVSFLKCKALYNYDIALRKKKNQGKQNTWKIDHVNCADCYAPRPVTVLPEKRPSEHAAYHICLLCLFCQDDFTIRQGPGQPSSIISKLPRKLESSELPHKRNSNHTRLDQPFVASRIKVTKSKLHSLVRASVYKTKRLTNIFSIHKQFFEPSSSSSRKETIQPTLLYSSMAKHSPPPSVSPYKEPLRQRAEQLYQLNMVQSKKNQAYLTQLTSAPIHTSSIQSTDVSAETTIDLLNISHSPSGSSTAVPFTSSIDAPSTEQDVNSTYSSHPTLFPSLGEIPILAPQLTLVPTSSPSYDTCKPWCANHPTPWRHPDPNMQRKCEWVKNCSGCPECAEPSPYPPCEYWCKFHEAPWTHPNPDVNQKCRFWNRCAGCPQCVKPSEYPSENSIYHSAFPSTSFSDVPTEPPSYLTAIPSIYLTKSPTAPKISQNPTTVPTNKSFKDPPLHPTILRSLNPTENLSLELTIHRSKSPTRNTQSKSPQSNKPTLDPTLRSTRLQNMRNTTNTRIPSKDSSLSPSAYPTKDTTDHFTLYPSYNPSPSPIEVQMVNATVFISLHVKGKMTNDTIHAFEKVTMDFLLGSALVYSEFFLNIFEVDVVDQIAIESGSDESLKLLSENEFQKLVDEHNSELQNSSSFLLLEFIVHGEVESIGTTTFSFEAKVREILKTNKRDYGEGLVQASPFFDGIMFESIESNSETSAKPSSFSGTMVTITVVVGALVGSLVVVSTCLFLLRRKSGRSKWRDGTAMRTFVLSKCLRGNEVKRKKNKGLRRLDDHPQIVFISPTASQYPQSVNLASQESFSTLTFRDYKEDKLKNQGKASTEFKTDNLQPRTNSFKSQNSVPATFPEENAVTSCLHALKSYKCTSKKDSTIHPVSKAQNGASKKRFYEIHASPGPLGLVVKSSDDGPVICEINPMSPLIGLVEENDIIVFVNDVDTRTMSAITFAQYIVKNEQQPKRKITILRTEDDGGNPDELMSL